MIEAPSELLIALLPLDIARKVGYENAIHILELELPSR
jgi:hypothetical protein